jgi:hypothetical protein
MPLAFCYGGATHLPQMFMFLGPWTSYLPSPCSLRTCGLEAPMEPPLEWLGLRHDEMGDGLRGPQENYYPPEDGEDDEDDEDDDAEEDDSDEGEEVDEGGGLRASDAPALVRDARHRIVDRRY